MLIKFFDLEGGCLVEAGRLLNAHLFYKVVSLFCNKIVKNKSQRFSKVEFKHDIAVETLRKNPAFS